MQSDLMQRIDGAMQRPSRALALGFSLFVVLLMFAWLISGDRLDSTWFAMAWLPVVFGLFCAGLAARQNPVKSLSTIYNSIVLPLLIVVMITAHLWGPYVASLMMDHPTLTVVLLLNAVVWVYHTAIGIVYVALEFIHPNHWAIGKPSVDGEP